MTAPGGPDPPRRNPRTPCGFAVAYFFSPCFVIAQKYACEWSVEDDNSKFRNGTLAALDQVADAGGLRSCPAFMARQLSPKCEATQ